MCKVPAFEELGWTFLGELDQACMSELVCDGSVPACNAENHGKTVQDRRGAMPGYNCVADWCEVGSQIAKNTFFCDHSAPSAGPTAPLPETAPLPLASAEYLHPWGRTRD